MSGLSGKDSSDDFFQSFGAADASNSNSRNSNVNSRAASTSRPAAATTARRKAPPPPPPRRSAAGVTATTTSSRPVTTTLRAASRPAAAMTPTARPTATAARPALASRRPASTATTSASSSSSSYYGANAVAASSRSAANRYAASRVAAPSSQNYYQAPADDFASPPAAYNPNFGGTTTTMSAGALPLQPSQGYDTQESQGFAQAPGFAQQPFGISSAYRGTSEGALEGTMDEGAASTRTTATAKPNVFVPLAKSASSSSFGGGGNGYFEDPDEPPLLEELGINPEHIWLKVKAVVLPSTRIWGKNNISALVLDPTLIVGDADLAGPAAFALLLGGELLLTGKIQFGYIYGFALFGCLFMTLVINLMSPLQAVSVWTVTSILGYALLPVNLLAALKIVLQVVNLPSLVQLLAVLTILWSTVASTRLLEVGCQLRNQRYLLAYPLSLLYSAFVLITIF